MELSKEEKLRIFVRAMEVIPTPAQFIHDDFARDARGFPVSVSNPAAVAFCVRGAICKALLEAGYARWEPDTRPEHILRNEAEVILGVDDLGGWNNVNDHPAVLAGLRKVVETLKAA